MCVHDDPLRMRWRVTDPMLTTHIHIGVHVNLEIHDLHVGQRGTLCKPHLQTKSDRGKEVAQRAGSLTVAGASVGLIAFERERFVVLNKLGTSMHIVYKGGFYEGLDMTNARVGREELRRLFNIGAEFGVVDPNL